MCAYNIYIYIYLLTFSEFQHSFVCYWSLQTAYVMELFSGGDLDERVMERAGCLNYSHTPWENEKIDVFMRQVYYKFNKGITRHRGEVTSTQQKTRLSDRQGWLIEEIMTLHGVPLGDYFNVRILLHNKL